MIIESMTNKELGMIIVMYHGYSQNNFHTVSLTTENHYKETSTQMTKKG